jgi:hypothetical protein
VKFPITKEILQKIAAHSSTSIRVFYMDGEGKQQPYDCEFGKKKYDVLKKAANCIM